MFFCLYNACFALQLLITFTIVVFLEDLTLEFFTLMLYGIIFSKVVCREMYVACK